MELFIDPRDERGMTVQLYDQLREAILAGRIRPGDRLDATRRVAAELGVARSTVAEAYYRLGAEGYITGRAGGGSVVSPVPATTPDGPRRTRAHLAPVPSAAAVRPYGEPERPPAVFDFRPGTLDPRLFPIADWRRCMLRALDHPAGSYGDPAGSPALREALARWVTRSRGVRAAAEEVFVTSGAGHAVDLIARVLVPSGSVVAVEEPGYPPVVELLRNHGFEVVGVPVDDEGIVVDALPERAKLVYVTPSHQYPLGMPMSRRRRLELLDWAARVGCPIIEDDYDSEFRHTARPLEPLQRLDADGWVLYVGTFSKSLSPALRLGFLVAPLSLIPGLCALRQVIDWSPPQATQAALASLIGGGHLDRHLRRCRAVYAERRRLLWDGLGAVLPAGYRRLPSVAGLHIAVLSPDADPEPVMPAGVRYSRLGRCYSFGPGRNGCLLGFAGIPTALLPDAVSAFGTVLRHPVPEFRGARRP
jgi:GntR family transcriptional regulator/MocR family aminotransferase